MYTQKEINKVLRIYDKLRSQRETVRVLGYPSRNLLRRMTHFERNYDAKLDPDTAATIPLGEKNCSCFVRARIS